MGLSKDYRWSSQISDITRDPASAAWGAFCPCLLFARNVHSITDGDVSFVRACLFHLLLGGCWGTAASFVCGPIGYWFTCVPCYAAQYRRRLRQKQGLPEMPYSDFTTHFLCHPFAEHREINLKQSQSVPGPGGSTIDRGPDETVTHVEAVQKMER
ncbi:cell number regulator 5 isoform X2 [Cryptomeria japonica]|uniref:cell number regulator 5 isoform X2 n=1 Tax=Cryptomeria japonica TaxID=3369 RepID=UPI0027D9F08F|nr:cell number regulator 5 isoform X2 [Cryptomeria japonica]